LRTRARGKTGVVEILGERKGAQLSYVLATFIYSGADRTTEGHMSTFQDCRALANREAQFSGIELESFARAMCLEPEAIGAFTAAD